MNSARALAPAVQLAAACLLAGTLAGLSACSGVPDDPQSTTQRDQRMKADCERRGGIWYPASRSCTNSDPILR